MPFTPAHAAAAWPVNRWLPRLPLAALVIGTMAPDFRYMLPATRLGAMSHTPIGLLAYALPLGFLVWLGYRRWIRPSLVGLLPLPLRGAVIDQPASVALYLAALVAVWVGAGTHVAWDGFTHDYGWAVSRFTVLRAYALPAILPELRWYKVLQHGSTVVGLMVVALWMRRQLGSLRAFSRDELRRALVVVAILLGTAAVGGALNGARVADEGFRLTVRFVAVGGMAGFTLALLCFGLYSREVRRA